MKKQLILFFLLFASAVSLKADSLDSLDNAVIIDTTIVGCRGTVTVPGGYTETGIYIDTLLLNGQCTIRTLDLTLFPQPADTFESLCFEEGDFPSETPVPGTYFVVIIDNNGCESTHTAEVNLTPPDEFINEFLCAGSSFTYQGVLIDSDTTVVFEKFDMGPCPYDFYFTVEFFEDSTVEPEEREICNGDLIIWNGRELTEPGTYTEKLTNSFGCDSSAVLMLTAGSPETIADTISLCEGEVLVYDGLTIEENGDFFLAYEGTQACVDSVLLTVEFMSKEVIDIAVCDVNDIPTDTNGSESCIDTIWTVIANTSSFTFHSICMGDSIEWNGIFYSKPVVVSLEMEDEFGCSITDILTVEFAPDEDCTTSTDDQLNTENFVIYPNPVTDNLLIILDKQIRLANLEIYSSQGLIKRFTIQNERKTIDVSDMDSGLYFVKVIDNQNTIQTQSFVKL